MHYYQFNIGDYASHTSRLSPIEDLSYRRMLDLYYLNEQPLSLCLSDVAREIGLSEYLDEVTYVLNKFFIETELGFAQKRIDLEIKKYKSNHKSKIKAGKASAKARQAKASSGDSHVEQVLNTSTTNDELNINHKPLTINHKPDIKDSCDLQSPKSKVSNVPYDAIINLYHSILPALPSVKIKTEARKKALKARHINELNSNLENWEGYFKHIANNCQWMLGGQYSINFDYLITLKNYVSIIEGAKSDR